MTPTRVVQQLCCRSLQAQNVPHISTAHRLYSTTTPLFDTSSSALPRVAHPSFWASMIPKPFRRSTSPSSSKPRRSNPMTSFILLGIFVGSNAINLIALRNDNLNFSRKTDAKLSLLREVIKKVKSGEDVDVGKALGTGDPHEEAEWEEVVQELEKTDMLWEGRQKRIAKREEKARAREEENAREQAEVVRNREEKRKEWARLREGSASDHPGMEAQPTNEQQRQDRPKFLM